MLLLIPNGLVGFLARVFSAFFVLAFTVQAQTVKEIDEIEQILKDLQGQTNELKITVKTNSEPSPLGEEAVANFTLSIEEVSKDPRKANKILQKMDFGQIRAPKEEQIDGWFNSYSLFADPPMCGVLKGVSLGQIGVTKRYQTLREYVFKSDMGVTITIPQNTVYDRASIPRILSVFITKDEIGPVAPLLHDYIYRHGGVLRQADVFHYRLFSRVDADNIFLEAMRKCGVPRLRRNLAWAAVRSGGIIAWKSPSRNAE